VINGSCGPSRIPPRPVGLRRPSPLRSGLLVAIEQHVGHLGRGAERQAKDFLGILDRYPDIRAALRASVLVADRRWNLRLANGIDVRLPENDVEGALDRLVALDRDKKLLSRDIVAVDLRLPDRVTVRLSDAAAQAREDAVKEKKKKNGGDA